MEGLKKGIERELSDERKIEIYDLHGLLRTVSDATFSKIVDYAKDQARLERLRVEKKDTLRLIKGGG